MQPAQSLSSPLLIVGLGNPGSTYAATRHNAGWQAVERLAGELNLSWRSVKDGQIADGQVGETKLTLLRPTTFMNLSGRAVEGVLGGRPAVGANLLVLSDDVELKLGGWRVRAGGGHGGHNGLRSLIDSIGPSFTRIKIGVGPVPEHLGESAQDRALDQFVLGAFTPTERGQLERVLDDLITNLIESIRSGEIALATHTI